MRPVWSSLSGVWLLSIGSWSACDSSITEASCALASLSSLQTGSGWLDRAAKIFLLNCEATDVQSVHTHLYALLAVLTNATLRKTQKKTWRSLNPPPTTLRARNIPRWWRRRSSKKAMLSKLTMYTCSSLDFKTSFQNTVWEMFFNRYGITCLSLVVHFGERLCASCNTVILMSQGMKIPQDGTEDLVGIQECTKQQPQNETEQVPGASE